MKKNAYFVGIKGVGMTALSIYLKQKGFEVSGSDVLEVFPTDRILKQNGIKVIEGFKKENISKKYDFVISTGAHGGMTNPEVVEAKKHNIPVFLHGEYLGEITKEHETISVAGCHGKTTTSSMIAFLLVRFGLDPSYAIGTPEIIDIGPAGHYGKGKYFVVEADEYMTCTKTCKKSRFLWHHPKIAVVTNIDYDHPDVFFDIEHVKKTFMQFIDRLPNDGILIACIDDPNIREILPQVTGQIITYGFSSQADFRIENCSFSEGMSFMRINRKDIDLGDFVIRVSGRHNISNALAASIAANHIGMDWESIRKNLKKFSGTRRRMEQIGKVGKILFYDDYAHHPKEITATIEGIKKWFPQKRIIVIFQPHTYSRTKALYDDFIRAFQKADLAIITDIFASAREKKDKSVSCAKLVIEANKFRNNAVYLKGREEVVDFVSERIEKNDLYVTMGAGDVNLWHPSLMRAVSKKQN